MKPKFALGRIVVTPNAAKVLVDAGQEAKEFLSRHEHGDWGDIAAHEKEDYDQTLAQGSRVRFLSVYPLKTDKTIWVFTNLKRGETTVMLPDERLP